MRDEVPEQPSRQMRRAAKRCGPGRLEAMQRRVGRFTAAQDKARAQKGRVIGRRKP